ncbi:tyrosine-tRNA ligase [Cladochytrium replicatum]|nr:tyrosine-tRNA ligase [Cladochytrium replicatum]
MILRNVHRIHGIAQRQNARRLFHAGNGDPVSAMRDRGMIQAVTSERLSQQLRLHKTAIYAGFDPTAESLHVGNLLQIIGLLHFYIRGHDCVALVGGATGSIGDPSGRSTERTALSPEVLQRNTDRISHQLHKLFRNAKKHLRHNHNGKGEPSHGETLPTTTISVEVDGSLRIINNLQWFQGLHLLEFLSDVGRMARVGIMLSRDSVKNRMDTTEGLSFTEFSYQLLQAYDFAHLHSAHNVQVQIGGSDQWGNIVAGIDLIRRRSAQNGTSQSPLENDSEWDVSAYGVTLPLLTTSTGEKFGKSAGNAVWLDENMMSPYEFYQYLRRSPDSEVGKYLRFLTFLPTEEINRIMAEHKTAPQKHLPHRTLAREVTALVHGSDAAARAELQSLILFDNELNYLTRRAVLDAFGPQNTPPASTDDGHNSHHHHQEEILYRLPRYEAFPDGDESDTAMSVVELAVRSGVAKSKSAARKLVDANGLYLNGKKVAEHNPKIQKGQLLDGCIALLRSGKSKYKIILIE